MFDTQFGSTVMSSGGRSEFILYRHPSNLSLNRRNKSAAHLFVSYFFTSFKSCRRHNETRTHAMHARTHTHTHMRACAHSKLRLLFWHKHTVCRIRHTAHKYRQNDTCLSHTHTHMHSRTIMGKRARQPSLAMNETVCVRLRWHLRFKSENTK